MKKAARRARLDAKIVQGRFAMLNPAESAVLALLPVYRQTIADLSELESKSANAEDAALLRFYSAERTESDVEQTHEIEAGLQDLLRQLLDLRYTHPNRVIIAIYSENKDALFELAQGYYNTAVGTQMRVLVSHYTASLPAELEPEEEEKVIELLGRKVMREEIDKPAEFLRSKPGACTAIVFSLDGKSAYATWVGEHGLHTFVEGKTNDNVFVHASDVAAKDYRPPSSLAKRGAINPANVGARRRTYQRTEVYVEDHLLATRRDWRGGLRSLLTFFMDQQRQRAAESLIDE